MAKEITGEIRLGRIEMKIMNVVWDKGEATVHDVKEVLAQGRTPAYSTVLTMMRKLEAKGYLEHTVDDRTFVYQATITQQDVRQGVLGDIMARLFEGSPTLLFNSLVEQNGISETELREIQSLIKKRRETK